MPSSQELNKRTRLVDAAAKLIYRKGIGRTTIADIAEEANVPLGNVYYYFKTREAIVETLIQAHLARNRMVREGWDHEADPRDRLRAFVDMTLNNRRELARSGCPNGTLCTELQKDGGPLAKQASRLFTEWLIWLERQFRALGKGDESPDLAVQLLSALEGATLLTHSLRTPRYVESEGRRLMDWIGTL
jgi:TetR/AcrR family transcriptional regulator, transcriptional repressor for nem operon